MKTPTKSIKRLHREVAHARANHCMAIIHPDTLDWLLNVRNDLLEALKGVYALIESGQLRRNTSDDPNPDFAARQIPFVMALAKADRAIAKAKRD